MLTELKGSIKKDQRKELVIGLFGFGVVGKGLYEVLSKTSSFNAQIKKICIRDITKTRTADPALFTDRAGALLDDPEINVIVEVIDDAVAAHGILRSSLKNGKAFVTANKKLVAENLQEIISLQHEYSQPVLYEAACCASIPVIRNLEEYYDNDLLYSIRGIVNGSTNYILSKIFDEGLKYQDALLEAKQLGFAESDPSLDVKGFDAANKLSLLIAHGFGNIIEPRTLLFNGIDAIKPVDSNYARRHHYKIKLVATAQKLKDNNFTAFVLPQFINSEDELYNVNNEFNGLITESCFADKHFLKGKGAGAFPTAAAILSDLSALRYHYKYEYKKCGNDLKYNFVQDCPVKVYLSASALEDIPFEKFLDIEEQHTGAHEAWVIGSLSTGELIEDSWWKDPGFSLIACPDPFEYDLSQKKIRKRSLELAGI